MVGCLGCDDAPGTLPLKTAREPHMRLALLCTVCVAVGASAVLFGRRSWQGFLWWMFSRGDA